MDAPRGAVCPKRAAGALGADAPGLAQRRFSEPQKLLPVLFVVGLAAFLFWSYLQHHILVLLQLDHGARRLQQQIDHSMRRRGLTELVVFLCMTAMFVISYTRSILEDPGSIPDDDLQWQFGAARGDDAEVVPMEMKKTGERRHCKWCGKFKPDRCHHCRVCRSCVLKMDHHCPWIYNCVGFANYKYFFLLLLYSLATTLFIILTMAESVKRCIDEAGTPFRTVFLVFLTETLASVMAFVLTVFGAFHIWLMLMGLTTIEFCEKQATKRDGERRSSGASAYHLGLCGNIRAVLGDNMLLWLLPCSPPSGDGLSFVSDGTRLLGEEPGKGVRRRSHQRTQRTPPARFYAGYASTSTGER